MLAKMFKFNQEPDRLSAISLGIKQILDTPVASFIIIFTMTLALFFVTTFYICWQNIGALNERWNESAEISLYLKNKIGIKEAESLVEKLQSKPVIAKIELIKPEDGMRAFVANTMLNTLLSSFKENPLPSVIVIHPKIKLLADGARVEFIQELKNCVEVETVSVDQDWIEHGYYWLNSLDGLSWVFILLLSINALLVLGGISYVMPKIFMLKHKTHTLVLQYQFAWYGLISGFLALLWSRVIVVTLQNLDIHLQGLSVWGGIFIVLISVFLAMICARAGAR